MSNTDSEQLDEVTPNTPGVKPEPPAPKSRAYETLKRPLSEKELLNIGSVNLMIDDIHRMESEISSLKSFQDKFHEKDKSEAILKEKLTAYKLSEIVYNVSISMGALFIGIAIKLWDVEIYGKLSLGAGIILWLSGSAMKLGRMIAK
ncbi:TPA: hypothetical protein P0N76_000230 [Yersinia enterocolitica]|uniref:hypothetical protein n=1 Tax=Yersinia enterocolitica TaxID=630 RepID=UPI0029C27F6E|nr:hypothetical protein [Yersinia enterocolitica]EKN5979514.1 hypothetical protein [Yersinia enterocolitica]EKN6380638.1 hypothetical protein [Yersinia enterocolitica]HDM8275882.1 hypothetical protein [Yersinia enterocolitica]HEI6925588.1 hypothetical protein [Yersinia enterocolitica]